MSTSCDMSYMGMALAEARKAAAAGEVPVGAVLVRPGQSGQPNRVLARAHNQPITLNDPTAHAEMLALRQAAQELGNYRLDGCELYVTLEPCAMCAQALLHARIARVVYGAVEPKTGAAGSVVDILGNPQLNHQTTVQGGVMADECATLMQTFFAEQRRAARASAQPLRDDALRTPDTAFDPLWLALPGHWRAASRFTQQGEHLQGLRLHWMDLQPAEPNKRSNDGAAWLMLHGPRGWWPEWADKATERHALGHRVVLPDLIGFGLSDKPKKARWHTIGRHVAILADWLNHLGETNWVIAAQPEHRLLAEQLANRLHDAYSLPATLEWVEVHGPTHLPKGWCDWPYPDAGHQAARKAWPWPLA